MSWYGLISCQLYAACPLRSVTDLTVTGIAPRAPAVGARLCALANVARKVGLVQSLLMKNSFEADLNGGAAPLHHPWRLCVGSGHATTALRADWQAQLKRAQAELGFKYVRFHGLLDDDMGTLICQDEKLLYSFFNADQIIDFLLSIGMRPFMELSFMPGALSSGGETVFHYGANVTPPADEEQWATLMQKLAQHWVDRYGIGEVAQWYFEVWNEPNLQSFWKGTQEQYFSMYKATVKAIKGVDARLRVGGPASSKNAWLTDFRRYCEQHSLPVDFYSTHYYPTDGFGSIGTDSSAQLAKAPLDVMRTSALEARGMVGETPLHYTEWNITSNPRDLLHDEHFAAALAVRVVMDVDDVVQGYSYWTFTDIFEENYFPSKPFQGGFGLMNLHGIRKPVYHGLAMVAKLGQHHYPVKQSHPTLKLWVGELGDESRERCESHVLAINQTMPEHPIAQQEITLRLRGRPGYHVTSAHIARIDEDHANPLRMWQGWDEPTYLSAEQVEQLSKAGEPQPEPVDFDWHMGELTLKVTVAPQSVNLLTLGWEREQDNRQPVPNLDVSVDTLLDRMQKNSFDYFTHEVNPENGLIKDKTSPDSAASTAAVGMALTAYPIGVERGFMERADAAAITLRTLRFFADSEQSEGPVATGFKGFYYHFLDLHSGQRAQGCELSSIDTAVLMAGVLTAGQYFDGDAEGERDIRELATMLYERVDWQWMLAGSGLLCHGWKPEQGFLDSFWSSYSEAMILYILALGSPTHAIERKHYDEWTKGFDWQRAYGLDYLYAGPLFIHQMSHLWIDFRDIRDSFMDQHDSDYFENSRRATLVQQKYAIANPKGFIGYNQFCWGLSASDGPGPLKKTVNGVEREFLAYAARGAPHGPDDGTLAPWAVTASLPFAPGIVLPTLVNFAHVCMNEASRYGFKASFNPSCQTGTGSQAGWVSPCHYGINVGPTVVMIENHRYQFTWSLMRQNTYLKAGLKKAGFEGGWLKAARKPPE